MTARGRGGNEPVQVGLLDGFGVWRSGTAAAVPPCAERVVAWLALRGTSSRALVAGTLWPNRTERQASACLRTTLWRIRKACGPAVAAEGESIRLAGHVRVDVAEFVGTARRVIEDPAPGECDRAGVVLLSRVLLPGWRDDWVVFERDRLRQLGLHALEMLAARLSAEGRYGEARDVAARAIAAEPLRESAHRILAEIHLAEGDRGAARQRYEEYRGLLAGELGLRPSARFERLVAARPDVPDGPELAAAGIPTTS